MTTKVDRGRLGIYLKMHRENGSQIGRLLHCLELNELSATPCGRVALLGRRGKDRPESVSLLMKSECQGHGQQGRP
jgi:hypothetical protein